MNKLLVISGGTRGIGRAIAEKFAANGFDVITCARDAGRLSNLQREIQDKFGIALAFRQVDVASQKEIAEFARWINSFNRPVDVLVNNAGYFVPGKITEEEEGVLEKMLESNLLSAYRLTRGLVHGMIDRKAGHIFNMCSVASLFAYPNGGSYSITKFGLLGFSRVLREELKGKGIRVTSVISGATRTASWEGTDLSESRFMKPEDVADAVFGAYALSERSVVEEIIIRPQLGDI